VKRTAIAVLCAAFFGCAEARPRLDVPAVRIELEADTVDVGAAIRGRVVATDASGIVYVSVEACSDSLRRRTRYDTFAVDSITLDFDLDLGAPVAPGRLIEVRALVIDDQLFTVEVVDTVFVRGSSIPDSRPICRAVSARR